jgi:DHA1 family tetracycline resistance protein-like MFS transporter
MIRNQHNASHIIADLTSFCKAPFFFVTPLITSSIARYSLHYLNELSILIQSSNLMTQHKMLHLAPLFLVLVIDTMGMGIIFPILSPLFMGSTEGILPLNASLIERQFWYGATLMAWSILMFIGAPFLGDLSDRLGRKKVLLLALAGTAVGFTISAYGIDAKNIWILMAGRVIAGFFAGSQPIAQAVIADVSSAQDKVINMSMIIVANCLGFIIGPIVGGYFADPELVSWFTFSTPFYAAGGLAVINAALLLYTLHETHQPKKNVKLSLARGLIVFSEAFTNKKIRVLALILLLTEIAWSVYFLYIPIYLVETYHYNNINIAHYMSYMGLVFAFALTVMIRLLVKFMRLETLVAAMMVMMGIALPLLIFCNELGLWLMTIFITLPSALGYSIMITICSNAVSHEEQGWVMGITSSVVAAGFGLGSAAAGTLGVFGPALPFGTAALAALLSAALLFIWDRKFRVHDQSQLQNPQSAE